MWVKNRNILITGGAGFIGSHLADRIITEGAAQVVIIDSLFLGSERNLEDAVRKHGAVLYRDDAEDQDALAYIIERHRIDTVFNCATKALNYSFVNPRNACDTNTTVILNLLELQRKHAFDILCHFSSSEAYGTAVQEPMDERHPLRPTTTYAAGKAAADIILQSYVRMFGVNAVIVRPFNNYGPRQNHEGPLAAVIPLTVRRILAGLPPEIHGTGEQSRDFIHVLDTVDASIRVCEKLTPGDAVNISGTNQVTIRELIHTIARFMGYRGDFLMKEARGADVHCHIGSNEKLRSLIRFEPIPFEEGLRTTIDWYRERFTGGKG